MYVKVMVRAGAKRESLVAEKSDKLKITVKEPAEQNLANRRVIALAALHFGVPINKVKILNGHHSPSKMLSVDTA